MNKKQFSKQFDKHFTRLHDLVGGIVQSDDMAIISAFAAVCSDALVFCTLKMTGGDLERAAKAVSEAVNISLETTRENMKERK